MEKVFLSPWSDAMWLTRLDAREKHAPVPPLSPVRRSDPDQATDRPTEAEASASALVRARELLSRPDREIGLNGDHIFCRDLLHESHPTGVVS